MSEKTLKDFMSSSVETIAPEASLGEAARRMVTFNIGVLPVCHEKQQRLVGILTDRDIIVRAVALGRDLDNTKVSEAMSAPVWYCFWDEGVADAIRVMSQRSVRRLVVLNREKRLVGIVSLGDLVLDPEEGQQATRVLRQIYARNKVSVGEAA